MKLKIYFFSAQCLPELFHFRRQGSVILPRRDKVISEMTDCLSFRKNIYEYGMGDFSIQ
jgi:hypothetical protein